MQISGEWFLCDDGVTRPTILAKAQGTAGLFWEDRFLLDSGADRSVLSARLLQLLGLPPSGPPAGMTLQGVGGAGAFVVIQTALEFVREGGTSIHVRGSFAAFTSMSATDFSILGRDVLDHFDVILSRPRGEILLLSGLHRYTVSGP